LLFPFVYYLFEQSTKPKNILSSKPTNLTEEPEVSVIEKGLQEANQLLPLSEQANEQTHKQINAQLYDDLWLRIKDHLNFDIPETPRIQTQKKWYLKHPLYIKQISQRATPYLFHIVEQLEANQLPMELALLPIVESSFDAFAYSHGQASGLWQFIPSTGKSFGLTQNWWYDGRRDIYASTEAAIKLLKYLHKRFDGDWLHALAAYNSGEGNVNRAIKRNKKLGKATDFWSLKLPKETQAYVPKLLALASILTNQNSNGWLAIKNRAYFARVKLDSQIDLSLAASLAEINLDEFYQLNPGFNQWATAPNGPHHLLLPVDKISFFKERIASIPKDKRVLFKRYTIKSGDSLSRIAEKFHVSTDVIKENNSLTNNKIIAGKTLLIPSNTDTDNQYIKAARKQLLSKQKGSKQKIIVQVKSGDSLWSLSRKHKVSIKQLTQWNAISSKSTLRPGQKLIVWNDNKNLTHDITRKVYYKVRRGDSLGKIASKFNVSLMSIKKWNPKTTKKKYLKPGDSILIYINVTQTYAIR